jgi:FtsH-binding integral membrane protein
MFAAVSEPNPITTTILLAIYSLLALSLLVGWVLNIVAAVMAGRSGRPARWRFIFHIAGFFIIPLGGILGLLWNFKWRGNAKMKNG